MIEVLSIRNIALIDELELEFAPGLNIFTGETGAGKSVILKSMGIVLGERAGADIVREGTAAATVEIGVAPTPEHPFWEADAAAVLDADDTAILTRQIRANGRSRCRLNGHIANLRQLQTLGTLLVDIHGQHEHQSLFRTETHLHLLDDFGDCGELRRQAGKLYQHRQKLRREVRELTQAVRTSEREKERLEFECAELEAANLVEGEDETLAAEARVLSNAEALFETANLVTTQLQGGRRARQASSEVSVLELLKTVSKSLGKLCAMDASLSGVHERLDSSLYEIEDIAAHLCQYANTVEFNPMRLAEITERLELISKLRRRYGNTIEEILAYHADASQQLHALHFGIEKIEKLNAQLDEVTQEAQQVCAALSAKRTQVAKRLSLLIERELRTLGMDKARFIVSVQPKADENGALQIDGKRYAFGPDGMDAVAFLIAPNVGSEPRPIAKIASGGEISRVMLALKTVLVQVDAIPTLIFDEIDSGIGGKVADVVGKKLKQLAEFSQVICITHLPQIARFADKHFRVEKKVVGERTLITAKPLTPEERVDEIVRMHGGEETEAGFAHARELLVVREAFHSNAYR